MSDFDRVCQALSPGWKLNARRLDETQDRFTLEAPMPPGCRSAAKWLRLEGLEEGTYKCTLKAPPRRSRGQSRELQRQKLRRIGPLAATVVVCAETRGAFVPDLDEEEDETALYEPEATDPVARATLDRVEQLQAQKRQVEAELELEETKARAEKFRGGGGVDPTTVALMDQVRTLTAKVETLQSSRQDQLVSTLLQSMMESQATMQAQLFAAFTKGSGGGDPRDMLGSVRELAELLAVLREDAGGSEPKSEAGELMSMLLELRKRQRPEPGPPVPAHALPAAPGQAQPPPAAAPNGAPPPPPTPPAPDLAKQRVGHFLELVYAEIQAQADPVATADRFAESPVYDVLPVPVRDKLERGQVDEVIAALQEWAPPPVYDRFYNDVSGDPGRLAWLGAFLVALQEPEYSDEGGAGEEPAQRPGAPSFSEERRTVDPDSELERRRILAQEDVNDGETQV